MEIYEIVVGVPGELHGLKPKIAAALRAEWQTADVKFEDDQYGDCVVKSVMIPSAESMTDAVSGEEIATAAFMHAAQEIVSRICHPDS